jgi:hypothetical protein
MISILLLVGFGFFAGVGFAIHPLWLIAVILAVLTLVDWIRYRLGIGKPPWQH